MLQRAGGIKEERGYSLAEMLAVLILGAILLTLGAGALRNYWLTHSLYGGRDELISQLRRAQEQAVTEGIPRVFGVRLLVGSQTWALVEYDPEDGTCLEIQTNAFSSGTSPQSVTMATTDETDFCAANLAYAAGGAVPGRGASSFVWFYPRGTATPGTITLTNANLPGESAAATVTPITGRVSSS